MLFDYSCPNADGSVEGVRTEMSKLRYCFLGSFYGENRCDTLTLRDFLNFRSLPPVTSIKSSAQLSPYLLLLHSCDHANHHNHAPHPSRTSRMLPSCRRPHPHRPPPILHSSRGRRQHRPRPRPPHDRDIDVAVTPAALAAFFDAVKPGNTPFRIDQSETIEYASPRGFNIRVEFFVAGRACDVACRAPGAAGRGLCGRSGDSGAAAWEDRCAEG